MNSQTHFLRVAQGYKFMIRAKTSPKWSYLMNQSKNQTNHQYKGSATSGPDYIYIICIDILHISFENYS